MKKCARLIVTKVNDKYYLYDTRWFGYDTIGTFGQERIVKGNKYYRIEFGLSGRKPDTLRLNVIDEFETLEELNVKYKTSIDLLNDIFNSKALLNKMEIEVRK